MTIGQLDRITRYLIAFAAVATCYQPAMAGTINFKDWTASFSGGVEHWDNTSSAGTIAGSGPWGAPTGTYGVANAIDPPGPIQFTTEFSTGSVGTSINFLFSNNYAWGTGGFLILGNIHEYFEYTLSAWDFGGVPINVNAWTLLAEYPDGSPGQLGYFSTSSTGHCTSTSTTGNPSGQAICPGATTSSESFFVYDTGVDPNFGQGGVLLLGGLKNVGRIQLTLASNSLAPNGVGSDFILFNVGTPVPEPSSALLIGVVAGIVILRRRRQAARVE